MAAQYPARIDRAAELVSEDSPLVIDRRLENHCYGGQTRDQIVDRGLKMAFKYPNSHYMCWQLALETQDQYLAAGLFEAGLQDLYLPDRGKTSDNEQHSLAIACGGIGRDDVAMQLLKAGGPEQPPDNLCLLANRTFVRRAIWRSGADVPTPALGLPCGERYANGCTCRVRGCRRGQQTVARSNPASAARRAG